MPQVVGLDVGASSVKAAVFERGFRGLELTGFHKVDFDGGEPDGVARALREVVGRLQGANATVVTRLAGDRVLFRVLSFPMSDPRKLEQVIPFEVEQQIPYELDDMVVDHAILKRMPGGGASVLVGAARKDDLRELLATLSSCGIDPRMVAAGPAALASLATAIPGLAKGTIALVDAGFSRTDICIVESGRIAYTRTVSAGRADLMNAHVSSGGTGQDLERMDIGGDMGAAARAAADFVALEIRRTLLSAETEAGVFVDRIVLFGGLTRTRGFPALVERTAAAPVEEISFGGAEWAKAGFTSTTQSEAAASVALAFRVLADSPAAGVNFRRDEFAWRRSSKEISGVVRRVMWLGAALFLLSIVHYGVKERLLAGEKSALDEQIASEVLAAFPEIPRQRLSSPDTAVSIMQSNMDEARSRLQQLGGGGSSALDVLREFSAAVPEGAYIDVTKFSLQEGKAQIQCTLDSYEAGDRLVSALKRVEGFEEVESSSGGGSAGAGKRKVTIAFNVKVAGGEGS